MSGLTDAERNTLLNQLAALLKAAIGEPETDGRDLVAKAIAKSEARVRSGEWSTRVGRKNIEIATSAAAALYAADKVIQQKAVKRAFRGAVNAIAGIVNARIGFDLVPTLEV